MPLLFDSSCFTGIIGLMLLLYGSLSSKAAAIFCKLGKSSWNDAPSWARGLKKIDLDELYDFEAARLFFRWWLGPTLLVATFVLILLHCSSESASAWPSQITRP